MARGDIIKALDREALQIEAARLYRSGLSMAKVAQQLGCSTFTVQAMISTLIKKHHAESEAEIQAWIAEHIQRTEEMYVALQEKIDKGNTWAVNAGLAVLERQDKLLGLAQPDKSKVDQTTKIVVEYIDPPQPPALETPSIPRLTDGNDSPT